jgi:hypothetical protein
MTLKRWTVAAAPVLLPPCAAHAATEANFTAGTWGIWRSSALQHRTPRSGQRQSISAKASCRVRFPWKCGTWWHYADRSCSGCPILCRRATRRSAFVKWAHASPDRMPASSTRRAVPVSERALPMPALGSEADLDRGDPRCRGRAQGARRRHVRAARQIDRRDAREPRGDEPARLRLPVMLGVRH